MTAGSATASRSVSGTTGKLGDPLGRGATHEDGEAAEPGIACPPQQLEAGGRVVGDERGRAPAERGGDGALAARA